MGLRTPSRQGIPMIDLYRQRVQLWNELMFVQQRHARIG